MELRNPLSKFQLDALRPRPLVLDFSFSDLPGPLLIGEVLGGFIVKQTVIQVIESFDGGLGITIGDSVGEARLQAIADNHPSSEQDYDVNNNYEYGSATDVFVYFPTGTPTQGRARVIVYLN